MNRSNGSATNRKWPPLLVVGLTGGIASGKSTVAGMFGALGATVLDADALAREIVAPGEPALAEIAAAFGPAAILPDGSLDRRGLGGRVFGAASELERLNRITHERIRRKLSKKLQVLATVPPLPPVVVVEAAILVEAGWWASVDRIIVVVAQHSTQLSRLMAEHGLSAAQAAARIQSQLPTQDRLRYADHQVDGEAPLSETQQQVASIWDELVQLASSGNRRARRPGS